MKSSFTDFLLCGGVLSLIVALAWLIVGVGISPYSQVLFGDYYVTDRRFNRMRPSIAPRKRHQAG